MTHIQLLEKLDSQFNLAVRLADGTIPIPLETIDVPPDMHGFPPALIPVWSNSSGPYYVGYWRHWFCERPVTIVELNVEDNWMAIEIARNSSQLVRLVCLDLICNETEMRDVRKFCHQAGIDPTEFTEIRSIADATGQDSSGLRQLPGFGTSSPLQSCLDSNEYQGAFPHEHMQLTPENVRHISPFEVSGTLRQRILSSSFCPPWFSEDDREQLFRDLLTKSDLLGAWMTLNSSGWTLEAAANALAALSASTPDQQFHAMAGSWLAVRSSFENSQY